jgi:hypothetical protein
LLSLFILNLSGQVPTGQVLPHRELVPYSDYYFLGCADGGKMPLSRKYIAAAP